MQVLPEPSVELLLEIIAVGLWILVGYFFAQWRRSKDATEGWAHALNAQLRVLDRHDLLDEARDEVEAVALERGLTPEEIERARVEPSARAHDEP